MVVGFPAKSRLHVLKYRGNKNKAQQPREWSCLPLSPALRSAPRLLDPGFIIS